MDKYSIKVKRNIGNHKKTVSNQLELGSRKSITTKEYKIHMGMSVQVNCIYIYSYYILGHQ
jgi:hypothetical protein